MPLAIGVVSLLSKLLSTSSVDFRDCVLSRCLTMTGKKRTSNNSLTVWAIQKRLAFSLVT